MFESHWNVLWMNISKQKLPMSSVMLRSNKGCLEKWGLPSEKVNCRMIFPA